VSDTERRCSIHIYSINKRISERKIISEEMKWYRKQQTGSHIEGNNSPKFHSIQEALPDHPCYSVDLECPPKGPRVKDLIDSLWHYGRG
jgi:hypothetical protein